MSLYRNHDFAILRTWMVGGLDDRNATRSFLPGLLLGIDDCIDHTRHGESNKYARIYSNHDLGAIVEAREILCELDWGDYDCLGQWNVNRLVLTSSEATLNHILQSCWRNRKQQESLKA